MKALRRGEGVPMMFAEMARSELYPPQYRFLGLSGYAVTIVGAACVAAIYLMRTRSRDALTPVPGGQ